MMDPDCLQKLVEKMERIITNKFEQPQSETK